MNDVNSNDMEFFATSRRVKKEEPIPAKSPLDTGTKWGGQEVRQEIKVSTNQENSSLNSQNISHTYRVTPISNQENPIGNIGTELQKLRKYPERHYDKLMNKVVMFNPEEYFLVRELASEISLARKRSSIPNKGELPRVTENTVIRAALKAIFSKIGKTNTDFTALQTEESLENYFNSLLK